MYKTILIYIHTLQKLIVNIPFYPYLFVFIASHKTYPFATLTNTQSCIEFTQSCIEFQKL